MEVEIDHELSRITLDHIAELYSIYDKREGIHLSTLVYCLTRSFWNQQDIALPTDEEVMLFALGYGLQEVMTPKTASMPIYTKDGITFSPDFQVLIRNEDRTVEVKTVRMSSEKDFPDTWIDYIKGGCYIREINEYYLSVLYMMGNWKPPFPEIRSFKLTFTNEELEENWRYILVRKAVYEEALANNYPPAPFLWCKEWECKNCRFRMTCQAIVDAQARLQGGSREP